VGSIGTTMSQGSIGDAAGDLSIELIDAAENG
jgi:hypothetical protein